MSRTYRRKKAHWDLQWELRDYEERISKYGGVYFVKYKITASDPAFKKSLQKFHSDKERYGNNLPTNYMNMYFERPMRRKSKNLLYKYTQLPDDEIMLPEYIQDHGWDYF